MEWGGGYKMKALLPDNLKCIRQTQSGTILAVRNFETALGGQAWNKQMSILPIFDRTLERSCRT